MLNSGLIFQSPRLLNAPVNASVSQTQGEIDILGENIGFLTDLLACASAAWFAYIGLCQLLNMPLGQCLEKDSGSKLGKGPLPLLHPLSRQSRWGDVPFCSSGLVL